jgi:hypothetical protein
MTMKTGGAGATAAATGPKHHDAAANTRTGRPAQLLLPIRPPLRALKGEALPVDDGPIGMPAPPRELAAAADQGRAGL